jgi:hypothetical protein
VDIFDRLAPDPVLGRGDRERLDHGTPVVRVAAGKDGVLSLAASVGLAVTAERLRAILDPRDFTQKRGNPRGRRPSTRALVSTGLREYQPGNRLPPGPEPAIWGALWQTRLLVPCSTT